MTDSERRTVRPYLGVSGCQDMFNRVVLQVGAETCESKASIRIQERTFREGEISIRFADSDENYSSFVEELARTARELDFTEADLKVLAVATSPFRRLAEEIGRASCRERV